MNREHAWTASGKVRMWAFCFVTLAIASRFYVVQELLAAFAFFGIGFAALAFVVLSFYLLQRSWEVAALHVIDSERLMAGRTRGAIWWPSKTWPGQSRRRS
jgi:hypothetical protein